MPRRLATATLTLVAVGAGCAPALAANPGGKRIDSASRGAAMTSVQTRSAAPRAGERAHAASSGTITIEDQTFVSGPMVHGHPYTLDRVLQTPSGRGGAQNALTTTDDPRALAPRERLAVSGWSYVGGDEQFYSSTTNTIYVSSIWGPYLHPGSRPGSYVYRDAPGAPTLAHHPVNVTASQRQALLKGEAVIGLIGKQVGDKVKLEGPVVRNPVHGASEQQAVAQEIADHGLTLVGRTTVDGRAALKYTGQTGGAYSTQDVYLDPATHVPFEQIYGPGTARQEVIRLSLRTLPITPATERRLSLSALHPNARIDRSHEDYLRAAHGTEYFPG
jgi:hypothetical protein